MEEFDVKNSAEFREMMRFEMDRWTERMKQAAQEGRLVATGEMIESFQTGAQKLLSDGLEQKILLVGYARFRDLRSLNYARTPPISAIRAWVEAKGVSNFGWSAGGKIADSFAAADKIAWAIARNKLDVPNEKRAYRGIYSRIITEGMYELMSKILGFEARHKIKGLKRAVSYSV